MKTLKLGLVCLLFPVTLGLTTIPQTQIKSATLAEVECLARNIYHEARGEPLEGQIAVAQVTVNRVHSKKFQNTVCGVVHARSQFSWTLNKHKKVKDSKAWKASLDIARAVLTQSIKLPNFEALYFHTRQVHPYWNRGKRVVARIGNHVFYS